MNTRKIFIFVTFGLCLLVGLAPAALIKKGQVLKIAVKGQEDLSRIVAVAEDGTIDYPLYQNRKVVGLSTTELMDELTLILAKNIDNPFVIVSVLESYPIRVNVLGQVLKPGWVQVPKGASLQEVLLAAGGSTEFADLTNIRMLRAGEGMFKGGSVNLETFISQGDLSVLPEVREGDTYILPTTQNRKQIKVLGAVNRPGFFPRIIDGTVEDMIVLAGGFTADADPRRVRYITMVDKVKVETMLNMKAYYSTLDTSLVLPKVKDSDIIYVYSKAFTWKEFLEYVRDTATLISLVLLITSLTKG
jgi:protein involved in polysaccharide export with SLBB domain